VSLIEELGFESEERVVVVHVDDVGMSRAANDGALDALAGAATCGSIMVPCPAFEEIAAVARGRSELDFGVHLTLNAEYPEYRWPPLCDDVPGLVSPDGGMWPTLREVVEHATPEEVDRELRAQIDRALGAGVDVTHLDSHMGTVLEPKFIDVYIQLARDYTLPSFIPRLGPQVLARAAGSERIEFYVKLLGEVEASGLPVFDYFCADSLSFEPGTGLAHNKSRLERFGAGLSYLITHCARGDDQLQSITADWRQRDEEHRIYGDGSMGREIAAAGIRSIGMRPLRDLVRGKRAAPPEAR
jgi:predicted glycoside hydrolase/deacetylase ChbG (UPF0249 family)